MNDGKYILRGMAAAPEKGLPPKLKRLLGNPHSAYKQTLNKRTGKKGPRICCMKNECLTCDGTCKGYKSTEKRMRPAREAYAKRQKELREKLKSSRAPAARSPRRPRVAISTSRS